MTLDLPGLTDDEQRTLNRLMNQLSVKQTRNALRSCYYDGKRLVNRLQSLVPPQYFHLGLCLGWAAKAVDLPSRRATVNQFVWPDGDLDSLGITESWTGNNTRSRVSSAIKSSMIHSTSFLINTLGDPERGEPQGLIHVKDAMSATGDMNSRAGDRLDSLLSITRWGSADPANPENRGGAVLGLALYLNNLTITAERDEIQGMGLSEWTVTRYAHPWGVPAEAVVYKPQEGRPFGSSRISRPLMAIHDSAVRSLIRLEGHMDVYSWPEMFLLGADASIFKNQDGSMKAEWQVMLGRVKGIPDDETAAVPRADVKQFPASSPEPHLAQLNALAKLFAREASLPDTSIAITDVSNPTSGESYDASQHELISEVEGSIDDWSPAIARAQIRALAMQNDERVIPSSWKSIAPVFRNPRYTSRAAEADAGQKTLAAVPWLADTEVGLELLGLSPSQIRRALAERDVRALTSESALLADALGRNITPEVPELQ
ncbi:MAG TPA: phage portal protein [Rhodoglobus sp.]|nr:phage portal protein [Rhodoglobus sp.]